MSIDLPSTHRSPRDLVKHDLREWARDVVNLAPTGISPLEAVRQLALTQRPSDGPSETRSRRVAPDTRVRRLPWVSQRMDESLRKVARIDHRYHRALWVWAATGSMVKVSCEMKIARGEATALFEGGVALLLAFHAA